MTYHARGSLEVRLRFRVIGSGSSGNTTLVEAGPSRLLVDAGLGPRDLAERLDSAGVDPASLAGILLSHEHQDHARGAASFAKKWGVPVFASRGTWTAAGLSEAGVPAGHTLQPGGATLLAGFSVSGVAIPHDASAPLAFVIESEGRRLGHVTDCGHVSRGLVEALRECDAVLVESNHDADMLREGPYPWSLKERILGRWGHLSNDEVGHYLGTGLPERCRTVVLAHLSQTNNHPEVARLSAEAALRRRGRTEVRLEITGPEGTGWIEVAPTGAPRSGPAQLRLF